MTKATDLISVEELLAEKFNPETALVEPLNLNVPGTPKGNPRGRSRWRRVWYNENEPSGYFFNDRGKGYNRFFYKE